MAQSFTTYLPFLKDDLKLIEEAVDRVMAELRHPFIDRVQVRTAILLEMRRGAPVMFRLVKAGRRACDDAADEAGAVSSPHAVATGLLTIAQPTGPR